MEIGLQGIACATLLLWVIAGVHHWFYSNDSIWYSTTKCVALAIWLGLCKAIACLLLLTVFVVLVALALRV